MTYFTKENVRLGVLLGAIAAVAVFLSNIPLIGWIFTICYWLVGLVLGYSSVYVKGFKKEQLRDAFAFAIPAVLVAALVTGLFSIISAAFFLSSIFNGFWGIFVYIILILVPFLSMGLFAIAGIAIGMYFPPEKLSLSIIPYLEKIKKFVEN